MTELLISLIKEIKHFCIENRNSIIAYIVLAVVLYSLYNSIIMVWFTIMLGLAIIHIGGIGSDDMMRYEYPLLETLFIVAKFVIYYPTIIIGCCLIVYYILKDLGFIQF